MLNTSKIDKYQFEMHSINFSEIYFKYSKFAGLLILQKKVFFKISNICY